MKELISADLNQENFSIDLPKIDIEYISIDKVVFPFQIEENIRMINTPQNQIKYGDNHSGIVEVIMESGWSPNHPVNIIPLGVWQGDKDHNFFKVGEMYWYALNGNGRVFKLLSKGNFFKSNLLPVRIAKYDYTVDPFNPMDRMLSQLPDNIVEPLSNIGIMMMIHEVLTKAKTSDEGKGLQTQMINKLHKRGFKSLTKARMSQLFCAVRNTQLFEYVKAGFFSEGVSRVFSSTNGLAAQNQGLTEEKYIELCKEKFYSEKGEKEALNVSERMGKDVIQEYLESLKEKNIDEIHNSTEIEVQEKQNSSIIEYSYEDIPANLPEGSSRPAIKSALEPVSLPSLSNVAVTREVEDENILTRSEIASFLTSLELSISNDLVPGKSLVSIIKNALKHSPTQSVETVISSVNTIKNLNKKSR